MTLEIIEQELLERKDSKIILKDIDGIWEPELHTLRINFKESDFEKDRFGKIIFPITVRALLDNDSRGIDIFKLNVSDLTEENRVWRLEDNNINVILDVVFPSSVCADISTEKNTADVQYIESRGKVVLGNLYDLLSSSLSSADLEKLADKESWYRYIRISNDRSLSSAQHIDKDGKIISQEYIYYKYSNLKIFFDGGKTRLFNLDPEMIYLKLSGYADREEYYVKGDSKPVLLGTSVVHIKEVPSLEINPRERDKDLFSGRFNYSTFTLNCSEDAEGAKLISDSPKSINFISRNSGTIETSNTIYFGSGEPQNDIWEFLEASTDLENYLDSAGNPVFFLSGKTTISFVVWNAFRESVYYSENNLALKGDIASHFELKAQSWNINKWDDEKSGVVEINIISDGEDVSGVLSVVDTEDESTIATISVKTLPANKKDGVVVLDSSGNHLDDIEFSPDNGNDNSVYFDILGISKTAETLKYRFFNIYSLSCPLTMYQSHSHVSVSSEDGESKNIINTDKATYLGDREEIDLSLYINQNIILRYEKTYTLIAPGEFRDGTEGPNQYIIEGDSAQRKEFKVGTTIESGMTVVHYTLGASSDRLSSTYIYLVSDVDEENKLKIEYSGFSYQEIDKYLFGYLLVGDNLDSPESISKSSTLIPVYTLPNVRATRIKTAYDRCSGTDDYFIGVQDVLNAVSEARSAGDLDSDRNIIVGTGATWIDLILPDRSYILPGGVVKSFKYNIKIPTASHSYILADTGRWDTLTSGKGELEVEGGENNPIKIPIIIDSLPKTLTDVVVSVQIGDIETTKISETFHLYKEVTGISFYDNNIKDGNILIYVEPTDLYYPGRITLRRGPRVVGHGNHAYTTTIAYGPAFNSVIYSPFQIMKTHLASISKLSPDSFSLYDGVVSRGMDGTTWTDGFNWSSSRNTSDLHNVREISSKNEYDNPEYHSKFVPEYRNYEITYKLKKIDDYFPQYPTGKIAINIGADTKNLYLFYMPANPYTLSVASKKHNIYIPSSGSTGVISDQFVVSSNYFTFSDNSYNTPFEVNIPSDYTDNYAVRPARYLFHGDGLIRSVTLGDKPDVATAFNSITIEKLNSSIYHESSVLVSYQFDPTKWSGSVSNSSTNYAAELFVMVATGAGHRNIFPDNISSIVGQNYIHWEYPVDYSWSERYYSVGDKDIFIPGEQNGNEYILTDGAGPHGTTQKVRWPAFRCQLRVSDSQNAGESDIMASCYGTTYPWEVPGDKMGQNDFTVFPTSTSTGLDFIRLGVRESNTDHSKTMVNVLVGSNIPRDAILPTDRIEEAYYKTRRGYVKTNDSIPLYLNIEQQPSYGYFYYRSGTRDAGIYAACQDPSLESVVAEDKVLGRASGDLVFCFEYLDTSEISNYMGTHSNQNPTFLNYLTEPSRETYDWRGGEDIDEVFNISISGDLDLTYSIDLDYTEEDLKIGKITIHYGENTSEAEKLGVFKITRSDNEADVVVLNLTQPGNTLVSGYSGIMNSAGVGRISFATEYQHSSISFSGASDIRFSGMFDGVLEYMVQFPENHTPIPTTRQITVVSGDSETILDIPQGYHGIHIWKDGQGNGEDSYSLDCDSSGKYVLGSMDNLVDLDDKYCFEFYHSEPISSGGPLETKLSDSSKAYSNFNISDLNIKSVSYQIVSPNSKSYEVSDVFPSLSADVVYDGTASDPYPYIQTLGTVYENKKELGLALVVELEISMWYTTELTFVPVSPRTETQTLEATNKIQIWYKI